MAWVGRGAVLANRVSRYVVRAIEPIVARGAQAAEFA
jgi:hypothetical protein